MFLVCFGFLTDLKFHRIMVRERHLQNVNPLEFTEVAFMP